MANNSESGNGNRGERRSFGDTNNLKKDVSSYSGDIWLLEEFVNETGHTVTLYKPKKQPIVMRPTKKK